MAVIQYTALVNQIRGKVNGSVLNKARTVNTVQKKQQQPVGARGYQSEIRQTFSQGQRFWKELTPVQKQSWQQAADYNPSRDRFGNQVILSGYNQYIKARVLNSYSGQNTPLQAFAGAAPDVEFEINNVYETAFSLSSSGGVVFSTFLEDVVYTPTQGFGYILDISLPVSAGVTSYHGRWVNVAGGRIYPNISNLVYQDLGTYYPMPSVGQRVLYRVRVVYAATGTVVREFIGQFDNWVLLPTIDSFTVTPNTGPAPYLFEATFSNKESFGSELFTFKAFYVAYFGICPQPSQIVVLDAPLANGLFSMGSYVWDTSVSSGECWGFKLQVVGSLSGRVMQERVVYISNV